MTLRSTLAVLLCVCLLFIVPVTVVESLLEENDRRTKVSEEARNWSQAIQGVATVVAIAVGGLWTYSVFVLRGSHTTHVQIQLEFKKVIRTTDKSEAAIISVRLKNGGQVPVIKDDCVAGIKYFTEEELTQSLVEGSIGTSLVDFSGTSKWEPIFEGSPTGLLPGEEKIEDVLFKLEESRWFEVGVQFRGHIKREPGLFVDVHRVDSSMRMIVDAREAQLGPPDPFRRQS